MSDRLTLAIQENILVLLCFDKKHCKMIRNLVEPDLFESIYRDIAVRAYAYIDRFNEPPQEHISDELEEILNGKDKRKAKRYEDVLLNLYGSKDTVNPDYTISRLSSFIREQRLRAAIIESAEVLQSGSEDAAADAELIIGRAIKTNIDTFDPGVRLSDVDRVLRFLDKQDKAFRTGISVLDEKNLGPARKALHLFIGLPKRGKTWWLTNLGKRALVDRYKVCHITLEVSEEITIQRYIQSLFGVAKWSQLDYLVTDFGIDSLGRVEDLIRRKINPSAFLDDPNIRNILKKKITRWGSRFDRLLVKEFPTSKLTTKQLEGYLDTLESVGFIPDLLLVDYIDLMKIDSRNYRHDLGGLYKDLRGIAVDRNIAVATVSQSNREGLSRKSLDEGNIAEDFSKIGTADTVITYNQTKAEKVLGLARLIVTNARNDTDGLTALISQNYAMGTFVRGAVPLKAKDVYFEAVDKTGAEGEEDEG